MAFGQPEKICNPDFYMEISSHIGLKEAEKGSNFIFSPLSIRTVLSMVAVGSKGRTLEQMLRFLNSESVDGLNSDCSRLLQLVSAGGGYNGGPTLSCLNGVWADKSFPLKRSYKEVVNSVYKAEAKTVDFRTQANEVAKEVNLWAENATNGRIKNLLPAGSLSKDTMLVLANTLYFKGAWNSQFPPSQTQDRDFRLLNGSTIHVPFMTSRANQFIGSFDGFKVLKLPYKRGQDERQFSMYVFLPSERDGLLNLIQKMGTEPGFLDHHLQLREERVGQFWLPKFKFSFGFEASEVLKQLGLVLPFSVPGELSEMVQSAQSCNLCVSDVFHGSFIEVNEQGTEAAAATRILIRCCGMQSQPVDFVADHPFLFMIRENISGAVLFIGNMINPLRTN